jgi:DNA-binding NarL/FixJ family response regulator
MAQSLRTGDDVQAAEHRAKIGVTMAHSLHRRSSSGHTEAHQRNLVLVEEVDADGSGTKDPIRVLVVHGDRLARAGLRALLDAEPDVSVTGCAADGEEAVALAAELHPDVMLIDLTGPCIDVIDVTQRIVADPSASTPHILIVGASETGEEIFSSLRAGASGFLASDTEPTDLMHGIRAVAAGDAALSPAGVRRLIAELATQPERRLAGPEQLDELTAREREVMALVAGGLTNDDIAEQLVVTRATAKTHVSRVMGKLGARHRAEVVTLAYETGLVHPRPSQGAGRVVAAGDLAVA